MKAVLKTPYHYFLIVAIIFFAASFFVRSATDIHLHDTYFVVSDKIILWCCIVALLFIWSLYMLLRRILLAKWLTWTHVLSSLFFMAFICTASAWYHPAIRARVSYASLQAQSMVALKTALPFLISFIAGQMAFLVNVIGGLVRYVVKGQ